MKATKNIMKVKQTDLFDFKKSTAQRVMRGDPTTSMISVIKSNTQSVTTVFM